MKTEEVNQIMENITEADNLSIIREALTNCKLTTDEESEDNIFCLIGGFINRLKTEEFHIIDKDDNIRLNKEGDKLMMMDEIKGKMAEELNKIFMVMEK